MAMAVVGLLTMTTAAFAAPSISPKTITAVLFPGQSLTVEKTVVTPAIPPTPDIYFLADTTGSMGLAIGNVQAEAAAVLAAIKAIQPEAAFGAGDYKDFPYDPYAFKNAAPIADDDGVAALAAIAGWTAGGGADGPEAQFYALDQLTTLGGWRAEASAKIVVWFGDWPAHDQVCAAISGLAYDISEASLTAKLLAEEVTVIAISTTTGLPEGLDGAPAPYSYDYGVCGAPGGAPGQATRIAAATGGVHLTNVAPADIAAAILAGLKAVEVNVSMASTCEWPIATMFTPSVATKPSGDPVPFLEAITVAADAPGGTYTCRDYAKINGQPMVDAAGAVIYESKTIKVPEGFLTGGGQILKDGGGVSFGGNVGYLADFSIVGQWHVNDPATKLIMHSTSIDSLQFFVTAGEGPYPPDANANTALFDGTARVKVGNAKWVETCTFTAYARDQGEPAFAGDPDGFGIRIVCGANVYTYGRAPLDTGNLQIHSGLKD
jgi:hypothetical protein